MTKIADLPGRRLASFGLLFALCLGIRASLIVRRDVPAELEGNPWPP